MHARTFSRSVLWLLGTFAILTIGITGCGDGESEAGSNEWVGTWSLETIDGQSMEQNYSHYGHATIFSNTWRFNSDGSLEGEITIKITPKQGGGLTPENGSIKFTGLYFLSGSNYTLSNGEAEATGFFARLDDAEGITTLENISGTWTRSGDTRTLISEYNTSVFKKI